MKRPSFHELIFFLKASSLITIFFCVIYFYANSIADQKHTLQLYSDFELNIPFIPSFIIIYFSINLLMSMPLFYFDISEMKNFTLQLILGTMIAGIIFVLFPCELGFERVIPIGFFSGVYERLFLLDRPHNLAPSLHIFYTYATILNLSKVTKVKIFHLWGMLMCLSVLFTHQHHLLDIVSGMLLSYLLFKFIKYK